MYARIIDFDFKPGRQSEAVQIFQQIMADVRQQQSGFKDGYLLGDAQNNKGLALVLFDSEADLIRTEETGFYAKQVERLRPTLSSDPQQGHFELRFSTWGPESGGAALRSGSAARLVRWTTGADKTDQATEMFQTVTQDADAVDGFSGAFLFFNSTDRASVSMTFWESRQQMEQTESSGWWQKQVDRFKELMEGAPTRQHYELLYATQTGETARVAQEAAQPEQPRQGGEM